MKDFEILDQALSEIKGGLTNLFELSIIVSLEERICSTYCSETCSGSAGAVTGTTKGVIIDKPTPVDPPVGEPAEPANP